jgi:plastocyanin
MTDMPRRRRLLEALAGAGALGLAGCSAGGLDDLSDGGGDGGASGDDPVPGEETTPDDVEAYCAGGRPGDDATAPLTVTVGPDDAPVFDPPTVEIAPGDTLRWEWDSDDHNVRVDDQPREAEWRGTAGDETDTYDAGHTYERTFDVEGRYYYRCEEHVGEGMRGEVRVDPDVTAPCQTMGEDGTARIVVGPGGEFVFDPVTNVTSTLPVGTEVTFEWDSDNHNVVVTSKPTDSDWAGFETVRNQGHEATHTFTEPGRYEFHCQPHKNLGMQGAFVVSDLEPPDAVVDVGPDGNPGIEPSVLEVSVGDVVEWRWQSSNHELDVASQPSDADWRTIHRTLRAEGYVERHRFQVPGRYEYFCRRHVDEEVVGEVRVVDDDS